MIGSVFSRELNIFAILTHPDNGRGEMVADIPYIWIWIIKNGTGGYTIYFDLDYKKTEQEDLLSKSRMEGHLFQSTHTYI